MQHSENLSGTIAAEDLHVVYCEDEDRLFFKEYKSQTSAKRECTRRNKSEPGRWKWTTRQRFDAEIDVIVYTYNMLSGIRRPVPIRKSLLGTSCDPACESYHST